MTKSRIRNYIVSNRFELGLSIVFFGILILSVFHHEMWRDETQAWLIARDSHSPLDLLRNLRYEGHPPLWHILLFITSRFTGNPFSMQLMHSMIATSIVYLVAKYSPFSKLQKVIYSFGYFSLFEYGVIARNYSLGLLGVIIFCTLATKKKRNYYLLGLTILFTTQTSPMGIIISVPMITFIAYDFIESRDRNWRDLLKLGSLSGLGFLLYYIQIKLIPIDGAYTPFKSADSRNAISTLWQGFVPIPARIVSFWNTNIIGNLDARTALSIVLLIILVSLFSKNKKVLTTFITGSAVLFGFFYFENLGSMRQHGFWFVLFIMCAWLLLMAKNNKRNSISTLNIFQKLFIWTILLLQLAGGLIAVYKDSNLTFSRALSAVQFIDNNKLQTLPIVAGADYQASSILAYKNSKAYFPQIKAWGSFVKWNNARTKLPDDSQILQAARYVAGEKGQALILSPRLLKSDEHINLVGKYDQPAVIVDEVFFIYLYQDGYAK